MGFLDTAIWYADAGNGSSTGYYAVPAWQAAHTYVCGNLIRQAATPAATHERVLACYNSVAGTGQSGGSEPGWSVNSGRGFKNTDNNVSWIDVTGLAVMNNDLTNAIIWTTVKNTAVSQGTVILNNAKTLVLVATVAGTASNGAEPSWAAYTATGATTTDGTVTWVTLMAVGTLTNWGAPFPNPDSVTLVGPPGYGVNGSTVYCADSAVGNSGNLCTQNSLGSLASPIKFISVNKSNVPPTSANLSAGSVVGIGLGGAALTYYAYCKGLNFKAPSSASNTTAFIQTGLGATNYLLLEDCTIDLTANTAAGTALSFNANNNPNGATIILKNPIIKFGNVGQIINGNPAAGILKFLGGSIALSGSVPTTLFGGNVPGVVLVEGVDLSAFAAGKTLVGALIGNTHMVFKDCKLNASLGARVAALTGAGVCIDFVHCDSAGNYLDERYMVHGQFTTETTIVRTGGASDRTQAVSWKVVTSANCSWFTPFECQPFWFWNDTIGSPISINVRGIWSGGSSPDVVPNNDDVWFDVVYFGDSGDPLGIIATCTKADVLAAGAAHGTDSSTWGGSTTPFKMTLTITPQKKGPIYIYPKVGRPSTTIYIDPKRLAA